MAGAKVISSRALVRYRAKTHGSATAFIARNYRRPSCVAELLGRQDWLHSLAILNDPTFPVSQGVRILHSIYTETDIRYNRSINYFFDKVGWRLLHPFMETHLPQVLDNLRHGDDLQKSRALCLLDPIAFHLSLDDRQVVNDGLAKLPPQFDNVREVISTRRKMASTTIAEHLEAIAGSSRGKDVFHAHFSETVRHHFEFIPDQNPEVKDPWSGQTFEVRVMRDHTASGYGEQTMLSLIRDPAITEDQIKRVQATCYCQRPYGGVVPYRDEVVFRGGGGVTHAMTRPDELPGLMRELITWVNSERTRNLPPLIRAFLFVGRYDKIHPFEGRTKHVGRFFAGKILIQGRNGVQMLPLIGPDFFLYARPVTQQPRQAHSFFDFDPAPQDLLGLAHHGLFSEYIFNSLVHFYNCMVVFYELYGQQVVPEGLRELMLSECDERQRFLIR